MLRREVTGARISDIFKIELDEILSRYTTGKENNRKEEYEKNKGREKNGKDPTTTPGLPQIFFFP